ncbi:Bug family tripartite tricarboxylate transporter substrate binding protein [Neoroseomonas rubea]|uniref:Bug family tripartite tricarboxylate transporter substrate binding protein n=1 Tax=Neoroseomonas rubea TaxID=2748666 RepID=UPI0018E04E61|nr:tripartite tricarboxylate transporter substrate binding protein [Roseomonas rubea]
MQRRAILASLVAAPAIAQAQPAPWAPARPVRLVVPFPPGGATDVVARLVAHRMGTALGQTVVVENRAGAGGTVGSDVVAKSAPDGHTLLVSNIASQGVGPSVYRTIPYDAMRDFTHIALLAAIPNVLIVNADRPVAYVAEFVAWARRDPGGIRVASPGNGSSSHVTLELFKRLAGIELTHVPYRGSGPAFNDVVANQIEAMITTLQEAGRNSRVRILAVMSEGRIPGWPDVPTIVEQGFPDLVASTWFGLSGPAGLPAPIADRLHAEALAALAAPDVAQRRAEIGAQSPPLSRADYTAFVQREITRWAEVVRVSGARVD